MEFIALHSDEIDMNEVSDCLANIGGLYIAKDEDELLDKIVESIEMVQFYKSLFIYPSKNSMPAFSLIKKIRELEKNIDYNMQAVIFTDCEIGIHLLSKLSFPTETFISSDISKIKILEAIK